MPGYEVDRARNMLADLEQQAVYARQEWRVQSARLTKVLRLDPRAVVDPLEHDHLQITLIDPGRTLDDLMPIALANRPEVASRKALVGAAEAAVRREKARPLIPVIAVTGFQTPFEMLQAGIFGIGPNSSLNQWAGRDDFSIQPLFQLKNCGFGNLAQIKSQRGMQSLAIIDFYEAQDKVAEEVTQAHARLQSAAVRVYQADRSLRTGIITLNGSVEGLQQTSRFGDVLVLISTAAGGRLRSSALEDGVRRVFHHGRRVQPGAIRAVPCDRLPGARDHRVQAAGRSAASADGEAHLPATGGQWTTTGHAMNAVSRRRVGGIRGDLAASPEAPRLAPGIWSRQEARA